MVNAELVWMQDYRDHYSFTKLERPGEDLQRICTINKDLQAEDN